MSDFSKTLAEWRHQLHNHPETAFEEVQTAAFVADKLKEMGIEETAAKRLPSARIWTLST